MPWAVAATVVVGAYSANQQKKAAQGAANAQTDASNKSIEEQRREFDISQKNNQPFLDAGYDALNRQNAFLNGDTSGFDQSADYKFAVNQGFQGLNYRGSSSGGFGAGGFAGGPDADRMALGQGLATQYAGNYWNKLADRAGQGQQGAQYLGQQGANMASAIGNAYGSAADARASAYGRQADANSQFASGVGNAFGSWYGQNKAQNGGGTGWYIGNNPGRG